MEKESILEQLMKVRMDGLHLPPEVLLLIDRYCHIPEKHFKMIRYGGLYARHREIDQKLHRAYA